MRHCSRFDKSSRQETDRVVLWPKDRHPPVRAGVSHEAALERRQKSGSYERGLPATGGAHDGKKAMARQPAHEFVALRVSTEEEIGLLLHIGADAGERI